MANRFANGRKAFGFCDVCGFRFDLKKLKNLVVKTKQTQIKACRACWVPDQPQLQLGMFPVSDPQAIRDPRPDTNTWYQSGTNGLQTDTVSGTGPLQEGFPGEGMLVIQWGWNPIGGARDFDAVLTPNTLVGVGEVGQATFAPWTSVFFTTPGTYSWTAPAGVTQVYVLCVGGGGSGGPNNGTGVPGGNSSFDTLFAGGGSAGAGVTGIGGAGGTGTTLSATVFGGNGGSGGSRATIASGCGGGAGGYSGNGGNGGNALTADGQNGSGGGAGGGGRASLSAGVGGGGVGINGQGTDGSGGTTLAPFGGGGSGGQTATGQAGGIYGGGGGGSGLAVTAGSGGGGGGLRWTFLTVLPGTTYPVVVGAGGVVAGAGAGGDGAVRINYLSVP